MAEGGGFEPPRPFGVRWAEFGPKLGHYSAREEPSVLRELVSPDSAVQVSLCFHFFRYAHANGVMTSAGRLRFEYSLLAGPERPPHPFIFTPYQFEAAVPS